MMHRGAHSQEELVVVMIRKSTRTMIDNVLKILKINFNCNWNADQLFSLSKSRSGLL